MPPHAVFSTSPGAYHDWQSTLLMRSHRLCGQPGTIGRLTSDYGRMNGDDYTPYNKPFGLRDWLRSTPDADEVLHVLDPDMVYLRPIDEEARRGAPVAESIFFMGMDAELHREIVARHARRNAELVQPIGVPLLIHRADLASFIDRWCELTVEMRATPETRAAIPWVCEQWACAIAAAEAGVRFRLTNLQQFPTEPYYGRPLIHYAYDIEGDGYRWSKRGYQPWRTIPPPPGDSAETGRKLWRLLDEAIGEFGGERHAPPPAPAPPPPAPAAPAPRDPMESCPDHVCRHGHGERCKAFATKHWRYCALTNPDHPAYNPAYLPIIAPQDETATATATAPVAAETMPRPSVDAHWLAKSCDYLGPICGRGCAGDRRICGAGRGAVDHSFCLLCVADLASPGGPTL